MAKLPKGTRLSSALQDSLFGGIDSLRTQVISRRKDFDALFDGFTKLRAISYVVSPDLLLEFFDKRGYTQAEVLVGENLSESYKQALEQKGVEVTEQLADRVQDGSLRIYIPDRIIHTKLYVLEAAERFRIIASSANLTEAARQASQQVNYAWYADISSESPLLKQVLQDYDAHLKFCTLFMDDLAQLFKEHPDVQKRR